jgi:polar amino acid transport system substrate-binding protein
VAVRSTAAACCLLAAARRFWGVLAGDVIAAPANFLPPHRAAMKSRHRRTIQTRGTREAARLESQVISDFMDAVYRDLVPSGTLRAALSYGNTGGLLVQRDTSSGDLRGLAVDLIDELAQRLSVRRSLVGYEGSVGALEAGLAGAWDVAILAIDSVRARQLDFTPPFVVLEGTYAIRELSPCRTVLDLDRAGMRISIVRDTVFDAHLTHSLRHAELVRSATYRDAADRFLAEGLEAVAGVEQQMAAFTQAHAGLRVIEGRFLAIALAFAVPRGRSAGLHYLKSFVEKVKGSQRVADALRCSSTPISH